MLVTRVSLRRGKKLTTVKLRTQDGLAMGMKIIVDDNSYTWEVERVYETVRDDDLDSRARSWKLA